jgi:Sulfotransferase family
MVRQLRRLAVGIAGALGLESRNRQRELQRRLTKALSERDTARRRLAKGAEAQQQLSDRADELAAELDRLRAAGDLADGRDRTDLQYLFVVTYGRSGSTLLQGILSSTPGVMIRGENGGLLQHLYQFHRTAARHRDRLEPSVPLPQEHPWWGLDGYRDDTAFRGFRTLMLETVLRPTVDTRLVGFKEIDWPTDGLTELLEFTRSVFPGARFVLNTRDLEQVAQSKWWARIPDALAELQTIEKTFVEATDPLGDAAYRVHYDDYVADPTVLRPLFEWLGLEFDESRVRAVMDVRHSY